MNRRFSTISFRKYLLEQKKNANKNARKMLMRHSIAYQCSTTSLYCICMDILRQRWRLAAIHHSHVRAIKLVDDENRKK